MTRRELLLWGSSALLPHTFVDISGVWETNLGPLRLKQTGSAVRGTYVTGTLTGSVRARLDSHYPGQAGGTEPAI